jgi:hypothetical protein
MTVSEWILIILAALTLAEGTPAFIREIREMSSASPVLANAVQSKSRSRRVIIRMFVLVLLAWGAVAFDFYDRHTYHGTVDLATLQSAFASFRDFKEVYRRPYSHETVMLDGLHCHDCSFDNVTFVWHGTTPYMLEHPHFVRDAQGGVDIILLSDNPIVFYAVQFLRGTGGFIPGLELKLHPGPS